MEKKKAISILNDLLEINNDRIEGYKNAINETADLELKRVFTQLMETSEKCKQELEAEILRYGEKPEEGTRATGKMFRVWMDIRTALSGKDRETILKLCEQGEDAAVNTYEKVLGNQPAEHLSLEQISMIDNQYKLIKSDHDLVRSLRDAEINMEK